MIKGTKLKTDDSITFMYLGIFQKMKKESLNIIGIRLTIGKKKSVIS